MSTSTFHVGAGNGVGTNGESMCEASETNRVATSQPEACMRWLTDGGCLPRSSAMPRSQRWILKHDLCMAVYQLSRTLQESCLVRCATHDMRSCPPLNVLHRMLERLNGGKLPWTGATSREGGEHLEINLDELVHEAVNDVVVDPAIGASLCERLIETIATNCEKGRGQQSAHEP